MTEFSLYLLNMLHTILSYRSAWDSRQKTHRKKDQRKDRTHNL